MRKFYLLSTLLISFNGLHSQIPKARTDTVRSVSTNLPPKDLTPTYLINPGFEDGLIGWMAIGNAFTQIVGGNMISSERVRIEMLYENGGIGLLFQS
jgi:hypothetical protein